jgi:uncharacterized protein YfdQ (DUF2303 family)
MSEINSDAVETMRELVQNAQEPRDHPAGGKYLVLPEGQDVHILSPLEAPLPETIREKVMLSQPESFIGYVNDYKGELTRVFADEKEHEIRAFIDYHDPDGEHERLGHRVIYKAEYSDQFKRWSQLNNTWTGQRDLAEFLEEALLDIVDPDHATILEIVNSLTISRKQEFKSDQNLSNGNVQLTYEIVDTTKSSKGEIEIPKKIELEIPVFKGGPLARFMCFFRYNLNDDGLRFMIKIAQYDDLVTKAFQTITDGIHAAIEIPILYGRPQGALNLSGY